MKKDKEKEELFNEILSLKERIKILEKDLIHDDLTGLKTRAFLEEELDENLREIFTKDKHDRKEGLSRKEISILFIDVDDFKNINDVYGHNIGDIVLKTVANVFKKNVRGTDVAARYGGEEFVIYFLGMSEEDAFIKAEKIRKSVKEVFFNDYPDLKISISIGVALAKNHSRVELIKSADIAMYKAKSSGKDRVVKYSNIEK
jgi:diguanylate cyclase (GGDEF)-like protein